MKKIISLFLLMLCSAKLYAGSADAGTLFNFHVMSDGHVIVYTHGARHNVPACAATHPARFVINGTTEVGKVQLSALLSAYAAKKPVVIYGLSACVMGSEMINYFYIP